MMLVTIAAISVASVMTLYIMSRDSLTRHLIVISTILLVSYAAYSALVVLGGNVLGELRDRYEVGVEP